MNPVLPAAGFGVLFNCPPRLLGLCFGFGAFALTVRTAGQEINDLGLPAASFLAAFSLAVLNRILEQPIRRAVQFSRWSAAFR